ncbi:MAG: glycosyltransferase family 2 protein [bacterium]|nr:glycosyltransferase family 2 protein [bacterium]
MTAFRWVFWVSAALIAYCAVVYPLLLLLLARLFPRPVRKGPATPDVAVVIPAHNEEKVIARKIENTLALDYPPGRLRVVVVSDGSTDATAEIAGGYASRGVSVIRFPEQRGKVPALLDAVPRIRCEVLVLSDASGMLRPDALREAVANFADPAVGCVCGTYASPGLAAGGRRGELLYWDYEFAIKRAQSRAGTLLGATGAMYAVRRELFVPPPPGTINDDFVIPALVVLAGHRAVLEERAVVDDYDPRHGNFASRVRVSAGNWQQLVILRGLLSPSRPAVAWQFLSHKVLRMAMPLLILAAAASALALSPRAAAAALLLFGCAALPWRGPRPLRTASSAARKFAAGNAAALYGMLVFLLMPGRLRWN